MGLPFKKDTRKLRMSEMRRKNVPLWRRLFHLAFLDNHPS